MLTTLIIIPMIAVVGLYAIAPAKSAGPTSVNLATAGNYAILAESGISTASATTSIVGDIGVSPIASTAITGFNLVLDPGTGTFSTSTLVTGKVYAADYAAPTPTILATAVQDMVAAYNDAAGRINPDFSELGSGDITSMTLVPGLYKWTTGVSVGAAGVTISGTASDVWIFQIAGVLSVAPSAMVMSSGGALASNIFWQVAGGATIGTNAMMEGIILSATTVVMNTGASLNGRALAQTAVTLDSNSITAPTAVIPEFSQVLIPLIGIVFVVAVVSSTRNQKGKKAV